MLHRQAIVAEGISKSFDRQPFDKHDLQIEAGEREAIGPNGAATPPNLT